MPKKIEIFENTLLKLLVRRGSDFDRKQVTLSEGELGYATDTKKLYIGDSQTVGGIPVGGSNFLGSVPDVTVLTSAALGDLAYDNDDGILYAFKGGDPTNIANWDIVGGVYTAGNNTITISNSNSITVNKLSAGNFSTNALGSGLRLDVSDKIALDSTIAVRTIDIEQGSSYLTIPSNISIDSANFILPSYIGGPGKFLTSQYDGTLLWDDAGNNTVYVAGTASQIPVGSIMPYISSSNAPTGWLLCNGQSVPGASYQELSAVIGTTYGGDTTNFNLPNFINKTIYGVGTSPSTSTTFSIASGLNSQLSASGALYIIKAKPDTVVDSTITISSPLTATLDGDDVTDSTINSLRGDLVIGTNLTNVPPGAVMAFAMDYAPAGWLDCNGDPVSRTTYAALCAAIGERYGSGNGTTTFNLPDLRGYFIRGEGTNSDGTASGPFAERQLDAFQGHWHSFGAATGFECSLDTNTCPADIIQCTSTGSTTAISGSNILQTKNHVRSATTDGTNGAPRIASETRPRNIVMKYAIKY